MQCLASSSALHTVEAIKQFVDVLNKQSHRQVFAAEHPYKQHKNISSTLVSLSQVANLGNNFPTRKQVTFE